MKKTLRFSILFGVLVAWCAVPSVLATEDLSESLDVKCAVCHDKAGSKLLTSKGKYFEMARTFDGHDEVIRKYRKCTKCHAKFPGSAKLTKKGQKMADSGKTMDHVIKEPAE